MLLRLNTPTFLKCLAHLAMTLLLLVSLLLLLSLPTNQMLVPVKQFWEAQANNSGSIKEYTLAHLIDLLIFLGLINHKIIIGFWAMILFIDSLMPLFLKGLFSNSFLSWLLFLLKFIFTLTLSFILNLPQAPKTRQFSLTRFSPDVHFSDFISITFKDHVTQGVHLSV